MSTFDYSGDLEWARWHLAVACVACKENGTEVAAVGVAVSTGMASVDVRPVCLDHAQSNDVFLFEPDISGSRYWLSKEDN